MARSAFVLYLLGSGAGCADLLGIPSDPRLIEASEAPGLSESRPFIEQRAGVTDVGSDAVSDASSAGPVNPTGPANDGLLPAIDGLLPANDGLPPANAVDVAQDAEAPPGTGAPPVDAGTPDLCGFGTPQRVLGLELSGTLWRPSLASDGSTLFLARSFGTDQGIFSATRSLPGTSFGPAREVVEVNGPALDGTPFISDDMLTLYLFSTRPGGSGDRDLWSATRSAPAASFQAMEQLRGINGPGRDQVPSLTPDERTLIWESVRPGGAGDSDLWLAERPSRAEDFGSPRNLAELNTPAEDGGPSLSSDGRILFFISNREGGLPDIWTAERTNAVSPFGAATPVAEVNSPADEHDPCISPDGQELFFSSNRSGSQELWVARRECP